MSLAEVTHSNSGGPPDIRDPPHLPASSPQYSVISIEICQKSSRPMSPFGKNEPGHRSCICSPQQAYHLHSTLYLSPGRLSGSSSPKLRRLQMRFPGAISPVEHSRGAFQWSILHHLCCGPRAPLRRKLATTNHLVDLCPNHVQL